MEVIMGTTIYERIILIMSVLGIGSQRQFALKANISPQSLNTMFAQKTDMRLSVIQDILKAYPEVRTDYFVLGEGDMLKPKDEQTEAKTAPSENYVKELEDHIATLKAYNTYLIKEVEELKREKTIQAAVAGVVGVQENRLEV